MELASLLSMHLGSSSHISHNQMVHSDSIHAKIWQHKCLRPVHNRDLKNAKTSVSSNRHLYALVEGASGSDDPAVVVVLEGGPGEPLAPDDGRL